MSFTPFSANLSRVMLIVVVVDRRDQNEHYRAIFTVIVVYYSYIWDFETCCATVTIT